MKDHHTEKQSYLLDDLSDSKLVVSVCSFLLTGKRTSDRSRNTGLTLKSWQVLASLSGQPTANEAN